MTRRLPLLLASALAPYLHAQYAVNTNGESGGALKPTDAAHIGAPYLDESRPVEERVEDLLKRLPDEEKASLLHGSGGFADYADIPRLGIPGIAMTDGPQGVRVAVPTTALPTGIALAASWDTDLAHDYGKRLGLDARATGHRILLAPGMNIARTPMNGRNFEYYGEDPLLCGKIAASYVRGVQSEKVAACVKHYAMNDQEAGRIGVDVQADERTLREIHLRAFEIAAKEGKPWTCMPGYNRVRGEYCVQNAHLNIDLMRKTFGFDGAFISDWDAWHDDAEAINGGCTIRMPYGKNPGYDARLVNLVKDGKVSRALFDEAARRNLRMLIRTGALDKAARRPARNTPDSFALARRAALGGMVLLKNDAGTLPFAAAKTRRVLVVGPNAAKRFTMPKGGGELRAFGGSGAGFAPEEITTLEAFREKLGAGAFTYPWVIDGDGIDREGLTSAAQSADAVVFVGGLDFSMEREAFIGKPIDKPSFKLPGPQAEVVRLLTQANPHTVAVIIGGSAMDLESIAKDAKSVVMAWYPGQEGGRAVTELLFGEKNFSGKLPITLGAKLTDWRVHRNGPESYPGVLFDAENKPAAKQPDLFTNQYAPKGTRVFYKEGVAVGYRGFEADGIRPLFPFGHGLSYTSFVYENASVRTAPDGAGEFTLTVKNIGKSDGAEVVQLYARPPKESLSRPEAERPVRGLIAFAKVPLKAGESRAVTLRFTDRELANWDNAAAKWVVHPGEWTLEAASSSADIRASVPFSPAK